MESPPQCCLLVVKHQVLVGGLSHGDCLVLPPFPRIVGNQESRTAMIVRWSIRAACTFHMLLVRGRYSTAGPADIDRMSTSFFISVCLRPS